MKKERKTNENKGITLIALIVTIIVLLILSGISISMLIGQNGILSRAAEAREKTKKETAREQIQLEVLGAINMQGNVDAEDLKTNLEKNIGADVSKIDDIQIDEALTGKIIVNGNEFYVDKNWNVLDYEGPTGTDIPDVSKTVADLNRANGTIDIVFLKNTGYNISETPNVPALDNTMVPIKYDETTKNWIVCSEADPEWYSYEKQEGTTDGKTSEWANVMLTDDIVVEKGRTTYDASTIKNLLTTNSLNTIVGGTVTEEGSMMVWIPRYAYRITYYDTDSKTNIIGYSDSRGIVTKEGETPSDYQTPTTSINVNGTLGSTTYEYYRPHPAFETDLDQGGWSNKLTGIWVGKFEATGTTSEVTIKSNSRAINNLTIGTLWQSIKDNFKAKSTESHMMKNSEWGAVAYLTESSYGRNGTPVTKDGNSGYYTGGSNTVGAYKDNIDQSTTGNVYGIYDTVGGTTEYIASYIANSKNSYGYQFASKDGQSTSTNDNDVSTEYATVYKYNSELDNITNNYNLSLNKIFGDGTTETSASGSGLASWHRAYSDFVYKTNPFFTRGGDYLNTYAGTFYFCAYNGSRDTYNASHVVCIVM